MYSPLFVCGDVLCLFSIWHAFSCVLFCFAIILKWKIFLLSHPCLVIVYVLCLFLAVPLVGLQCVIEVFSDHTRVLLDFTNHQSLTHQDKSNIMH